jgi:hypothetical protein
MCLEPFTTGCSGRETGAGRETPRYVNGEPPYSIFSYRLAITLWGVARLGGGPEWLHGHPKAKGDQATPAT